MVTPGAKREAAAHLCMVHGVSQRRACAVLKVDRSSVRYRSIRPEDGDLREAMKTVAGERRRFGYRRIHLMLERQGIVMNLKKLRRLYREEKLQVRKRGGRKRALGTRRPMLLPSRANERWSLDFVSDAFTDGRRFRVLAVVDDFSRECLALVADTSLSSLRVTRELDALIRLRGKPTMVVSDNGTELTSMAVLKWCQETTVEWHYIQPGSPCKTASSRASTAASGTNASTRRCFRHSPKHVPKSPHGRRTTTETGRIRPQMNRRTPRQSGRALGLRSDVATVMKYYAHASKDPTVTDVLFGTNLPQDSKAFPVNCYNKKTLSL
jgi:putative transposase